LNSRVVESSLSWRTKNVAEHCFRVTPSAATPGAQRLDVVGELDLAASAELANVLNGYLAAGSDLVLDMAAVEFIDSTSLGVLLRAHNELAATGGRLTIARPSAVVVRVLHLVGLWGQLGVEDPEA
jgi:stage II sporulation protein AA (anti-sigma F factor antagonist)